jgi:hypothetical protein
MGGQVKKFSSIITGIAIALLLTGIVGAVALADTLWISPTEYYDPYDEWSDEENIYDDDTGTYATEAAIPADTWGEFVELALDPLYCHKVRFYAYYSASMINKIDLDVAYDETWHNVYEGSYDDQTWVEKELSDGTQMVSAARVRFYNDYSSTQDAKLYEFDFYQSDPPAPTNMQFESVKVCRHLVEDDDFLLAFHYNIHYDSGQPDTPANKLFMFRMLDTGGTDYLGSIVPYAYNNSGYDQGCSAFYFPAADAPTWEEPYIIRISGNPEYFRDPPMANYTLVTSDYSQMETSEENQVLLGNYILDVARDLENNWDTTLLYEGDMGTVLNSTGEAYFRGSISGLQLMAPQIFSTQVTTPEYEETEWTEEQGQAYESRFEDTWVGRGLENLGDMLHMKWNVITGIMVLAAIVALAIFCQWRYATTKPALIGGILVMLGGTVMGWVAPAIMAIVTIFFALFLGYLWFFRHG